MIDILCVVANLCFEAEVAPIEGQVIKEGQTYASTYDFPVNDDAPRWRELSTRDRPSERPDRDNGSIQ